MERKTLAWHESLELHELTAFNSIGLMKLKTGINQIQDRSLKNIYQTTIREMEKSLKELLQFYPYAPKPGVSSEFRVDSSFYAGDLLAFLKTAVRNYSIAITETATPQLRKILINQLNTAILAHERIYNYMSQNDLYPSYDMNELLQNDIDLAQKALSM